MLDARVTIRPVEGSDVPVVEQVQAAAFGDHAVVVLPLLRDLQAMPASPFDLGLVAELDGAVVGHAHFSLSRVDAPLRLIDVSVLSPLAVRPDHHSSGIGGALVREGLAMLKARGVPAVFLEGSPDYYQRFGFQSGASLGFLKPSVRIPDAGFQVVILNETDGLSGMLVYAPAFWDNDAVGLRD